MGFVLIGSLRIKKQSKFPLKDAVGSIFDLLEKNNLLTPLEISTYQNPFYTYLLLKNLTPFINNRKMFLKEVEKTISTWPKDKIKYSFLISEFEILFLPNPEKSWLKILIEYQILVFISLLLSLGSLIIQVIKN